MVQITRFAGSMSRGRSRVAIRSARTLALRSERYAVRAALECDTATWWALRKVSAVCAFN